MLSTPIGRLRVVALLEGVSFLLLLGVGMPLKYWAGVPMAVKLTGWLHGLLFILFCIALARAVAATRWSAPRTSVVFVSSLLPFGTFLIDRMLRQEDEVFRGAREAP
jgi:integral membrane protein